MLKTRNPPVIVQRDKVQRLIPRRTYRVPFTKETVDLVLLRVVNACAVLFGQLVMLKLNLLYITMNSDHTCNQPDNTTQYNLRAPFKDNSLHIALYYHLTKNKSPIINQPYEIVSRNQVSLQTR